MHCQSGLSACPSASRPLHVHTPGPVHMATPPMHVPPPFPSPAPRLPTPNPPPTPTPPRALHTHTHTRPLARPHRNLAMPPTTASPTSPTGVQERVGLEPLPGQRPAVLPGPLRRRAQPRLDRPGRHGRVGGAAGHAPGRRGLPVAPARRPHRDAGAVAGRVFVLVRPAGNRTSGCGRPAGCTHSPGQLSCRAASPLPT